MTLYTAGHLHTAVPHCSHSRAPIVHTAVPRDNNEHGCVYLRCTAVCKLPGCVEGHPWNWIYWCRAAQVVQKWISQSLWPRSRPHNMEHLLKQCWNKYQHGFLMSIQGAGLVFCVLSQVRWASSHPMRQDVINVTSSLIGRDHPHMNMCYYLSLAPHSHDLRPYIETEPWFWRQHFIYNNITLHLTICDTWVLKHYGQWNTEILQH